MKPLGRPGVHHPISITAEPYGLSLQGREIVLHRSDSFHRGTLIIGGIHGDEAATIALAERFLDRYVATGEAGENIGVIPLANPDSFYLKTRYNARGVDLNRNFESKWSRASIEPSGGYPCSEPETQALRNLILEKEPARIITLHWALAEVDADGPQSTALAQAMWNALSDGEKLPYRLRTAVDAPDPEAFCPGSLGQWCGHHLRYADGVRPAVITLELPYEAGLRRPARLPDDHLETIRHTWNTEPETYLQGVEEAVYKMLLAAALFE